MEAPSPPGSAQRLRVLSFNVNGLRACLKRLHVSISQLLGLLNADVVCFQETKLRRGDLDAELCCVDGWVSFFCCDTTSATGYSGTATYCRAVAAMPFDAQLGFTGCAPLAAGSAGGAGAAAAAAASVAPHPALADRFSVEELTELDAEGRICVTDHGSLVLFNIYGPAITSGDEERAGERLRYKMRFYEALELVWRHLRRQGRAVMVVGDANICPAPIDHPAPDPAVDFYRASRPERLWLRRLLSRDGPGLAGSQAGSGGSGNDSGSGGHAGSCLFVDTFRHFHPTRQRAATCWSTATNARVNNWGSRIDLVLTSGLGIGQPPHAASTGSAASAAAAAAASAAAAAAAAVAAPADEAAAAAATVAAPAGRAASIAQPASAAGPGAAAVASDASVPAVWVVASEIWPEQQGSDHCPVFADLMCCAGALPCATKAPPAATCNAFAGRQSKLHKFLAPAPSGSAPALQEPADDPSSGATPQLPQQSAAILGPASGSQTSPASQASGMAAPNRQATGAAGAAGKKQASLKAFFQLPPRFPMPQRQQQQQQTDQQSDQQQLQSAQRGAADAAASPDCAAAAAAAAAEAEEAAARAARAEQSKAAWAGIMQKNKPPLCQHGEPAALLKVNKTGPNKGRYFYTCARAEGPPPEGKCKLFKWVEQRAGDHRLTTLGKQAPAGGGGGKNGGPAGKKVKT